MKLKKIYADECQEDIKACQVNVKLADGAHQSLLEIIQAELKTSIMSNFSNVNERIVDLLQFFKSSEGKIKTERMEVNHLLGELKAHTQLTAIYANLTGV